jgi:hypothetical protein
VHREEGSGLSFDAVVSNQGEVSDLQRFGVVNVTGNEGYDLLAMWIVQRHKKYTREF